MDKQLLKKFFLLFSASFVGILLICAIAVQTGFYRYKDHVAMYWEDEQHLANFATEQKNNSQLAFLRGGNGKVKAGVVETACQFLGGSNPIIAGACVVNTALPGISKAVDTIKIFSDCSADVSGTTNCFITSAVETANTVILGGPIYACKDPLYAGTPNEKCAIENSLIHHIPTDENYKITSGAGKTYGFIPAVYSLIVKTSQEVSYLSRIDLYYENTLAQIPLLNNKAQAAGELEYTIIKGVSFGQAFFDIWSTVRNISYYLIIIPVVALGFAIMFKVQINSQTQITLIKILPRLIVVMILITFSYPIAALMLQVSKPVVDLIISIFFTASADLTTGGTSYGGVIWFSLLALGLGIIIAFTGGIGLAILGTIVGIVLLITLFRYLMAVVSTTINLGFLIAFAPLILLVSVFPGREGITKQYFINLIAAIAGVMTIPVMLALAYLVWSIGIKIGQDAANLLIQFAVWMVAMGILWKTYDAPKIVAQAIGAKSLLAESGFGGEQKRR
ncbi:hypothetical protein KA001_02440 [Patescibacteria group bacterium]|nr:hypothetical protein [Patescibacteria group bacterium]